MNEQEYYEDEDNIAGTVTITVYKDNSYLVGTDLSVEDTTELIICVGDDLIEGNVAGLSHCEISNEIH